MKRRCKFIISFAKKYFVFFSLLFSCVLITTFVGSIYPSIFGKMIDAIVYEQKTRAFIKYTLIYALVFGAGLIFQFFIDYSWAKLNGTFLVNIRRTVFNNILHLKGEHFNSSYSGELVTKINYDCDQILSYIHGSIFHFIACIMHILLSLYFVFIRSKVLSILIIVLSVITVYFSRYLANKGVHYYQAVREKNGKLVSWLYEVFNRIQDVKIMFSHKNMKNAYMDMISGINSSRINVLNIDMRAERIRAGIFLITKCIIFVISVFMIKERLFTLGDFLAVVTYYEICVSQLEFLNKKLVTVKEKVVSIDRVLDLLNMETENISKEEVFNIKEGKIRFEDISFSYDKKNMILENLSFETNGKECIAIVGKNGAGKTTIINLLCRFYEASDGKISIDDVNIAEISLISLRSQISLVHQDIFMFNGTIRYNLIFSNDDNNDEEIWKALNMVGIDDFVKELPEGLDTKLSTFNSLLSGGQKQRIAIARALLKKCKILVFDESASALDSESERNIQMLWKELSRERTIIIIAHSLAISKYADRVIVIGNRKVLDEGTYDELRENSEHYRSLFSIK